jgi:hypothetical protein
MGTCNPTDFEFVPVAGMPRSNVLDHVTLRWLGLHGGNCFSLPPEWVTLNLDPLILEETQRRAKSTVNSWITYRVKCRQQICLMHWQSGMKVPPLHHPVWTPIKELEVCEQKLIVNPATGYIQINVGHHTKYTPSSGLSSKKETSNVALS